MNVRTDDNTDVKAAREVLDADHEGLDDVKDRMIEYLAVRSRRHARARGCGRSRLGSRSRAGRAARGGKDVARRVRCPGSRTQVRPLSLGGVRDEAEIRGHRRTYVGALPGRVVRAIREAGSMTRSCARRDRQARQRLPR